MIAVRRKLLTAQELNRIALRLSLSIENCNEERNHETRAEARTAEIWDVDPLEFAGRKLQRLVLMK